MGQVFAEQFPSSFYLIKQFFKTKRGQNGRQGKKDKGKREEQKKGKHTLKEKQKQKGSGYDICY